MKNFLKILLIGTFAITTLTGCEGGKPDEYKYIEHTLNTSEVLLIKTYYRGVHNRYKDYTLLYSAIAKSRVKFGDNNDLMATETDVPFCDVINELNVVEQTLQTEYQDKRDLSVIINKQWFQRFGITLNEQCGLVSESGTSVSKDIVPTPEQTNQQIIDDTVTIKEETLLSPAKVRELKTSIGECNIAKTKLIMLTDNNRYLTEKDYDVVTKLILDCEYDGLRSEMNK